MKQLKGLAFLIIFFNINAPAQVNTDTTKTSHFHKILPWAASGLLIGSGFFIAVDRDAEDLFLNNADIKEERDENYSNFNFSADDYLQYVPAASVFILDAFKVKARNQVPEQLALLMKSEILMIAMVHGLKNSGFEKRPDSPQKNSFPSGHTAQAFLAATFLSHEYGGKSIWYSVGAYSIATAVGSMRVLNNRHWISDVIAGAGFGIISTEIVYSTHKYKWGKYSKATSSLFPGTPSGAAGITFNLTF